MSDHPVRRLARGATVGLGATAVAFASALVPLGAAAAVEPGDQVSLMTFNDFHGAIGGARGLACQVETVRAEGTPAFLFSAGDNVGGSAFESAVANDEPTIDVLNALGVDASAIGNHEYDQGQDDLLNRIEDRTAFPDLAANVYDAEGERIHDAYTVIDRDGVKVAVIGAVTTKTVGKVSPAAIEGLTFGDPVDAVNDVVQEMAADGVEYDVLVATYHEGALSNAEPGVAPASPGAIFDKIVGETDPEVDAIFNGDSHRTYNFNAPVPGQDGEVRPIVQSGASASHLGVVTLEADADGDWDATAQPENRSAALAEADEEAGTPREECAVSSDVLTEVEEIAQAAIDDAAVIGAEPVGSITSDITTSWDDSKAEYVDGVRASKEPVGNQATTKGDNRMRHSAAGDMLADSMKWYLEDAGLDGEHEVIGFMNPGGIRAELWDQAAGAEGDGVVTYAEANSMVPFGNTLNSGEVTGAQFTQMLEEQWQRTADGGEVDAGDEPFLAFSVSENVEYVFDSTRERDDRIVDIRINGESIDPEGTYTIVTASFLFEGGDNMWALAEAQDVRDSGVLDRDAFLQYLQAKPDLEPGFGQRQVDAHLLEGDTPVLQLSGLESQSLGAPEITEVSVEAGELGTFTAPVETDQESGRLVAEVDLGEDFCVAEGEPVELTITTTPDTGTAVTHQLAAVGGEDCGTLSFTDVPESSKFHTEIMWMAENGYATGWDEEDGTHTFRPLQPVNRDAMAAFLWRLAGSPHVDAPRTEPFSDVEEGDEHYEAIIWAHQQGITRGWSDGTFRPTTPIARDAMAVFTYRYAGSPEVEAPTSDVFEDVSAQNKFATEIAWMKSEGITTGWSDGSFRPLNATNRDATAAFLYRLSVDQEITFLSEQE